MRHVLRAALGAAFLASLASAPRPADAMPTCSGANCCVRGSVGGACVLRDGRVPLRGADGKVSLGHWIQLKRGGGYLYGVADADGRTLIAPRHRWIVPLSDTAAIVPAPEGGEALLLDGKLQPATWSGRTSVSMGDTVPAVQFAVVGGSGDLRDLAGIRPDGTLGTPIRGVVGKGLRVGYHVVFTIRREDGTIGSVFADQSGEPFWTGPQVKTLREVARGGDGSCLASSEGVAMLELGPAPASLGGNLVVPLGSTGHPVPLPAGVQGLVPLELRGGCLGGWVVVSQEGGRVVYRVGADSPGVLLQRLDTLAPLADVTYLRSLRTRVPGSGTAQAAIFNEGIVAGQPVGGETWIARPALDPAIAAGTPAFGASPTAAGMVLLEQEAAAHAAMLAQWAAEKAARLAEKERFEAERARHRAIAEERFEAGIESNNVGVLLEVRALALYDLGEPYVGRAFAKLPARTRPEAVLACKYGSPATCAAAQESAGIATQARAAGPGWSTPPGTTVEVRNYDSYGNYLGTSTMSAWSFDIASW